MFLALLEIKTIVKIKKRVFINLIVNSGILKFFTGKRIFILKINNFKACMFIYVKIRLGIFKNSS